MPKDITLKEITKLTNALLKARNVADALYTRYEKARDNRDNIQETLLVAFRESDIKTIKRGKFSVGLRQRPGLAIINEVKVIKWLRRQRLGTYVEERLSKYFKLSVAPKFAKEGKIPNGCERVVTEYVSVRRGRKPKK